MTNWPKEYFLIKNQNLNKVVSVADGATAPGTDVIVEDQRKNATEIDRQLWFLQDGKLINKLSRLAIAPAGGTLKVGTKLVLCKPESNDVRQCSLSDVEQIQLDVANAKPAVVFGVNVGLFSKKEGAQVVLQEKRKVEMFNDRKEQRWELVAFKIVELPAPVISHISKTYASFPSGWFIISFPGLGNQVLTATADDQVLVSTLAAGAASSAFAFQLWTHSDGFLINRGKGATLDVKDRDIFDNAGLTTTSPRTFRAAESQNFLLQIDPAAAGKYRVAVVGNESYVVSDGIEKESSGVVSAIAGGIGNIVGFGKKKEEKHVGVLEKVGSKGFDIKSAQVSFKALVLDGPDEKVVKVEDVSAGEITNNEVERIKKLRADAKSWSSWIASLYGDDIPLLRIARFPEGEFFIGFREWGREYVVGTTSLGAFHTVAPGASIEVQPLDRKNYRAQLWRFRRDGKLQNVESGIVMDICDNKLVHGTKLIQWHAKDVDDSANQTFVLGSDRSIMLAEDVNLVLGVPSPLPTFASTDVLAGLPIALYKRDSASEGRKTVEFLYPVFKNGEVCGWEDKEAVVVDEDAVVINFGQSSASSTTKIVVDETAGFSTVQTTSTETDVIESTVTGTTTTAVESTAAEATATAMSAVASTSATNVAETTTTVTSYVEQDIRKRYALFPSGVFLIYFAAHGKDLVLTVEGNAVCVSKIDGSKIRYQLWEYIDGFLVNFASGLVLDLEGGNCVAGAKLIASKRKARISSASAQFGLFSTGLFFFTANEKLTISATSATTIVSATVSTSSTEGIGILIPRFKTKTVTKCSASGRTTDVTEVDYESYESCESYTLTVLSTSWEEIETISSQSTTSSWLTSAYSLASRRDEVTLATLPLGEFSLCIGTSGKEYTVLTVAGSKVVAAALSYQDAGKQLWRYEDGGKIVNVATGYALDVDGSSGVVVVDGEGAKWGFTTGGELIVRERPSFVVCSGEADQVSLVMRDTVESVRYKIVVLYVRFVAGARVSGSAWAIESCEEITHYETTETIKEDIRTTITVLTKYNVISQRKSAQFPSEWCLIYCQKHGTDYVLDVNPDDCVTIELRKFNPKARDSQMWKCEDGVWINQKYGNVLVPGIPFVPSPPSSSTPEPSDPSSSSSSSRISSIFRRSRSKQRSSSRSKSRSRSKSTSRLSRIFKSKRNSVGDDNDDDDPENAPPVGDVYPTDMETLKSYILASLEDGAGVKIAEADSRPVVETKWRIGRSSGICIETATVKLYIGAEAPVDGVGKVRLALSTEIDTRFTWGFRILTIKKVAKQTAVASPAQKIVKTIIHKRILRVARLPSEWFFIYFVGVSSEKYQVLTGNGDSVSVAELNYSECDLQLWKYEDGKLVNKASGLYLTILTGAASLQALSEKTMTQLFYYGADGTLFLQSSPTSVLSIGLSLEERTSATLERSQLGIIIPVWVRRGSIEVVETITKCEVVETGTVLVQTEGSGYAVKQASEVTEYELAAAATEVEEAVTIGQSSQSVETVQQLAQNTESVEQVSSTTTVAETVYQESSTDVYETTGAETTVTEKVETAYGTPAVETTITEKVETVYETPVATSTEYVNEKVETIETSYTAPVVETSTFVTQVTGTEVVEHTSVEETVAVSEEQFAVEHDVYTEIHEEYQVPVPTPEYTKVDSGPANPWSGDNYDMPADGGYGSGSYPSEEPKYETEKQVVESSTEYVTETYVTEKPSVETATEYVTETKSYVTEAPVVASSTEYVTTTTESTEPSITDTKTSTEYLTEVTSSESYVVEQPAVEISTEYTKTLVAETPVVVSSTEYTTETTYVTGNASTEYATEVSTAVAAEAASEYVTESSYAQVSEQPLEFSTQYTTTTESYAVEKPAVETSTEYVTTMETTETYVTEKPTVETSTQYITETTETSTEYVTTTESAESYATETTATTEYVTETVTSESYVVEKPTIETSTEYVTETTISESYVVEKPAVETSTEHVTETTTSESYVVEQPAVESSIEYVTDTSTSESYVVERPVVETSIEYVNETISSESYVVERPVVETSTEYVTETTTSEASVVEKPAAETSTEYVTETTTSESYVIEKPVVDQTREYVAESTSKIFHVERPVVETSTEYLTEITTSESYSVEKPVVETSVEYVAGTTTSESFIVEKPAVESSTEYVTETTTTESYVVEKPVVETSTEYVSETTISESYVAEKPIVETSTAYVTETSTTESYVVEKPVVQSSAEYVTETTTSQSYVVEKPAVESSTEYLTETITSGAYVVEKPVVDTYTTSTEYVTESTTYTSDRTETVIEKPAVEHDVYTEVHEEYQVPKPTYEVHSGPAAPSGGSDYDVPGDGGYGSGSYPVPEEQKYEAEKQTSTEYVAETLETDVSEKPVVESSNEYVTETTDTGVTEKPVIETTTEYSTTTETYVTEKPVVETSTEYVTSTDTYVTEKPVIETSTETYVSEKPVIATSTEYVTNTETTTTYVTEKRESTESTQFAAPVSTTTEYSTQIVESVSHSDAPAEYITSVTETVTGDKVSVVKDEVEYSTEYTTEYVTKTDITTEVTSYGVAADQVVEITAIVEVLLKTNRLASVKAFVFDIFAAVNWPKVIAAELAKAAEPHSIGELNWESFAVEWYSAFLKRESKTRTAFRASLDDITAAYSITCWSADELNRLAAIWNAVELYEDSTTAIKTIKDNYVASSFSDAPLSTLISLARNCKLCWNAQLSTELLGGSTRQSEIHGKVAEFLGYSPSEVVFVGSDLEAVKAAHSAGLLTSFVKRGQVVEEDTSFADIVVDKLVDLQAVVSTYQSKTKKPRGWFQRLTDVATDIGKAVAHATEE